MADIRQVQGNPSEVWDDLSWTDLNSDEQALWGSLGWNEASWDGDTDPPESYETYWDDLNSQEREALEQLGYGQESWDEE